MRILHFVPDIGVANGVMSVVLNYFRAMPEDIKFDVMYFKERERDRRADIEALGGRVFRINTPGIKSLISSELDDFFEEHKGEYAAVHIHAPYLTCLIAPKAKKHGIKKVAAHCHSTWYSLNPKKNGATDFSMFRHAFWRTGFLPAAATQDASGTGTTRTLRCYPMLSIALHMSLQKKKDLPHAANSDSARTNLSSDMLAEWLLRRRTTHILCVCLLK